MARIAMHLGPIVLMLIFWTHLCNCLKYPVWSDAFSINFSTLNGSYVSHGTMYYDWTLRKQRVDHSGGAYECVRFYNTTKPCTLLFDEKGMWAIIPSTNFCCLDLPIGPVNPDFLQTSNATLLGNNYIGNNYCQHWLYDNPDDTHSYWNLVSNTNIPCLFTFPNEGVQDFYFEVSTYQEGPQNPDLFTLPTNCKSSCK